MAQKEKGKRSQQFEGNSTLKLLVRVQLWTPSEWFSAPIGRVGDDVEIIADDVGEQEGFHAGGGGEARKLAALDARDVFADGVDLVNGGAAGKKEAGSGLFFFEGNALGGQGQEGGSSAGDQAEY